MPLSARNQIGDIDRTRGSSSFAFFHTHAVAGGFLRLLSQRGKPFPHLIPQLLMNGTLPPPQSWTHHELQPMWMLYLIFF